MNKLLFLCFALVSLSAFGQVTGSSHFTYVRLTPGAYRETWITNNDLYWHPHDTLPCGVSFPSDFNTRKCALMLFFSGQPTTSLLQAESVAVGQWQENNMALDHITIPGTNDSISIMVVYVWDSVRKAPPEIGAVPGLMRDLFRRYGTHIDTTRIYVSGISGGASTALACIATVDSVARYFKAVVAMNAPNPWKVAGPSDFDPAVIYPGTAVLLNRYRPHIWQMHTIQDGNAPYATQAIPWRDSCDHYAPGLNHLTSAPGFHYSMWLPWSRDTAGPEPSFFHAVANTIGLGGKPFTDSYYQWLLEYPAGVPAYLPVITGSVDYKWLHSNTYSVSFHGYNASEDQEYDVQESDDGINWRTVRKIPADGDRDYQETFDL